MYNILLYVYACNFHADFACRYTYYIILVAKPVWNEVSFTYVQLISD